MKIARLFWIALAAVMFLAVVAVVAGYVWINRYLAGDDFRHTVSQAASRTLGVEGEFEPFHWSGFAIYSGGFSARGTEGSPVDRIDLGELHAGLNLAAAFHGVWQVDRLDIGTFRLKLREVAARPVPPAMPAPGETPAAPAPAAPPSGGLLPGAFHLDAIGIREAEVVWPAAWAGGGRAAKIAVEMKAIEGGWAAEGHGGTFEMADVPRQEISDFALRIRPDRLYLTRADLRGTGETAGGTVHAAGEIGLGEAADIDLHIDAQGIPVTPFLPADWRARLFGNLAADFRLTRPAGPGAAWKAEGKTRLDEARLESLPILDQIATLTRTQDYRTLKFQTAQTEFIAAPNSLRLDHLAVESTGLVRVEGALSVTGVEETLDGTLQVGMPAARVHALFSADQIFTEPRGDYLWTPVRLGGTVDQPTEDLTPRVAAAIVQSVQKKMQGTVDQAVDLFRNLLK